MLPALLEDLSPGEMQGCVVTAVLTHSPPILTSPFHTDASPLLVLPSSRLLLCCLEAQGFWKQCLVSLEKPHTWSLEGLEVDPRAQFCTKVY